MEDRRTNEYQLAEYLQSVFENFGQQDQDFGCDSEKEFREWIGNSFREIVHPDDLKKVERSIVEQIQSSRFDLDYVEYRIVRKDGEVRWVEDYGHFVHNDEDGSIAVDMDRLIS